MFSSVWLGDLRKPHSKDLSIRNALSIFGLCKSMTREARWGERGLSSGSLHWHQVLLEPGQSFISPKSWTPWDWQLPLNWAPSPSPDLWLSIPVEGEWEKKEASCGEPISQCPMLWQAGRACRTHPRGLMNVTGIENLRKMFHDKIFLLPPFLDGKMLDVNVSSTVWGLGHFSLITWRAATLSMNRRVGPG